MMKNYQQNAAMLLPENETSNSRMVETEKTRDFLKNKANAVEIPRVRPYFP